MKTLRKNDPKEYWKILNTGKSTKQPDIEFKELFNFFKDLNTLKETNEPENTLNFDPTITAELNENINSPITKDKFSYALTCPYGVFSDCCLKFLYSVFQRYLFLQM
jgi:hypothetical protein